MMVCARSLSYSDFSQQAIIEFIYYMLILVRWVHWIKQWANLESRIILIFIPEVF